jgi:hypothetical protein
MLFSIYFGGKYQLSSLKGEGTMLFPNTTQESYNKINNLNLNTK